MNDTVTTKPSSADEPPSLDPEERVRSLRRITALDDWPVLGRPALPIRTIAVIDTETDGLDNRNDNIIEIAVALIEVDAGGRIVRIVDKGTARQDPGRMVPPKITQITGLDNKILQSCKIRVEALTAFITRADAVLAHNAGFDRVFCERFLPGITHLPWICSMRDVPWLDMGYDGAKLGHLLMQNGLFAPTAHNALDDVEALISLLACRLANGKTVMAEALANAQVPSVRIDAERAPFSIKDELKRFGYRFDWTNKVWWTEVSQTQAPFEEAWLARQSQYILARQTPVTWFNRHR
jgi:DNA polymerase-3 subunit epsilon